jgi:hypothetical protein
MSSLLFTPSVSTLCVPNEAHQILACSWKCLLLRRRFTDVCGWPAQAHAAFPRIHPVLHDRDPRHQAAELPAHGGVLAHCPRRDTREGRLVWLFVGPREGRPTSRESSLPTSIIIFTLNFLGILERILVCQLQYPLAVLDRFIPNSSPYPWLQLRQIYLKLSISALYNITLLHV